MTDQKSEALTPLIAVQWGQIGLDLLAQLQAWMQLQALLAAEGRTGPTLAEIDEHGVKLDDAARAALVAAIAAAPDEPLNNP